MGLELCPTSNLVTRKLSSLTQHHYPIFANGGGRLGGSRSSRVAICTDDTGLFSCTLVSELDDLMRAFSLTFAQVVDLQRNALEVSFLDAEEKVSLRNWLDARVRDILKEVGGRTGVM